jgi:hypothetical protein
VDGDLPGLGEREHRRRSHPRQKLPDGRKVLLRRVEHHVAAAAGRDDAPEHQLEPLDQVASIHERLPIRDQHRLRAEQSSYTPQAVDAGRRPGRDQIDDRIGEPEPRRRLDRARDRDQLCLDADCLEHRTRGDGVRSRNTQPGKVGELLLRGGRRHCRFERAAGEPELGQLGDVRAGLGDEVCAGDPDVDDAVLDVLGDVVRPDEQEVDRRVPARHVQCTLPELELKTGGVEQVERGLCHASLRRHGDEQPVGCAGAHADARSRRRQSRRLRSSAASVEPTTVLARAVEREPVAPRAVAQPLGDAGDGGGAGVHTLGDLEIRMPFVEQADDLPAVGERLELAEGAEVA